MITSDFNTKYPKISGLLPQDFWNNVDSIHPMEFNRQRSNTDFFDYVNRLISRTPSSEIVSQDRENLDHTKQFKSFLSEMIGYIATENWLCSTPKVLDVQGTEGLPEFVCSEFDVEVARILEESEVDEIRSHLEETLDGNCTVSIEQKHGYNPYASSFQDWKENEDAVKEAIDKIGDIDHGDLPVDIETDALSVKIREGTSDNVGYIGASHPRTINPAKDNKIPRTIKNKAEKCRGDRPLVVFLDLELQSVDEIEEVRWSTVGEPYGFGSRNRVKLSSEVEAVSSVWDEYLREIGGIPGGRSRGCPAIPPGDEGVFAYPDVECVAGVLVRLYNGEVGFIPNVYTEEVDAWGIFDSLGWETEARWLRSRDI